MNSTPHKIAIIGAGLAGLTAAHRLRGQGLAVRVFDKARGPGGRLSTRRHEPHHFDHGAQYFTVRNERFRRQVDGWIAGGHVQPWRGPIGTLENGQITPSENPPERFVGVPGMSAITRHLATELEVVAKHRLTGLEYRQEHGTWRLIMEEQGLLDDLFDAVVLTTPPAQAVPLLTACPALATQVAAVDMRPCWAVMASFEQPVDSPLDGAFVHESPLSWIARNSSKPGRPSGEHWVLHGSPEWSEEHLEDNPDDVIAQLLDAFESAIGHTLKPPEFVRAHRWRYAIARDPLEAGCLWDADRRVGVGGDWCQGSRVEGAFLSGLALAERILSIRV